MDTDAIACSEAGSTTRVIGIAVVFTLYTAVVFGFGIYLFGLIVTAMRGSIAFDYAAMGIATGGAQVAYLVAALLCPLLTRRFGDGWVIVSAVVASGLLLLVFAGIQNVVQGAVVLAGLGAAAACMIVPTVGAISKSVPFAYRSRVNGLVSSGTAYGQLANAMLVPSLLTGHGWRSVWLVTGAVSLTVMLLGFVTLRLLASHVFVRDASRGSIDGRGPSEPGRIVTARNLTVWILLALGGVVCGPWQNYLSSFLSEERGRSLEMIGQLWSIIGVTGLFSGFLAGVLADKVGVRIALIFSYATLACSALLIAFQAELWQLRAAAVCFGWSFYAIYGLIPAYISKTVEPNAATRVFAVANVFLGLGTTLGNALGGRIPGWYGSLQGVFVVASVLACAGVIVTMILQDERRVGSGG
ncbi:putative 3-hydroxyphenylpropionic transporter MhpT [Caballeronia pedi]|uniref:3-hydroxyphenylpropionic transporter MhpT n=1 Tax=Caballeronia pedi TaxID=1777141 RepID=A0A158CY10_9BURK|nr:MFS transporter [Caballeronia pedi]SAK86507.1 putative 3-hydroxyphenylpropionic transporter MhpT [Caballeronia pedi]